MSKSIFFLSLLFSWVVFAAEMGIPIQLKLKSPSGVYPSESGVHFHILVLSPVTGCILREEEFNSQNIVNGSVSFSLGKGSLGTLDPGLSLIQVYNNTNPKTGLTCIDGNNNVVSTGQTYNPMPEDSRVIRVHTTVTSEVIIVDFDQRAVPYAIQAESVGGKTLSELLVRNTSTELSQTNLENLLLNSSRLNNLINFASTGSANSATSFSGVLVGDVSGNQGSTVVDRIKGIPVSAIAPMGGQVLQFNGTQYVPTTPAASAVLSVAGKTGNVVLSSSDISGLGTAATQNVGTDIGNLVQLDGSGKLPSSTLPNSILTNSSVLTGDVSGTVSANTIISVGGKTSFEVANAVDEVATATASNVVSTIVKRDAAGSVVVGGLSSSNLSANNLYLYDGVNSIRVKAPTLGGNLVLTLPNSVGSTGQYLQTDGLGNLSWVTGNAGTITSVTATSPLSSSGGTTPNITISVGSSAGTVAAGDDSRITGALQTSAYSADLVAAASCTTTQVPYWNTVSDAWACQNINFPSDLVTSVAGRIGAVVLTSSDISGLGSAASLNVGVAAGEVVQLDGTARIPASTLPTNALTTASTHSGDVSGTYDNLSVDRIKGVQVSAVAPTTGQALVYNGSQWVPTTGFPSFKRSTADQTFSTTAVADVTNLSFAVVAGNVYKYKFSVMYTSAATTTGLRLGLTYPAVTSATGLANIASGADGTGAYFQGVLNSSGDSVVAANTPVVAPAVQFAVVEGIIVPTANGTVQLRAASEVAASNIIIKAGSLVEYTQLP